jgi:hypothetical protein
MLGMSTEELLLLRTRLLLEAASRRNNLLSLLVRLTQLAQRTVRMQEGDPWLGAALAQMEKSLAELCELDDLCS